MLPLHVRTDHLLQRFIIWTLEFLRWYLQEKETQDCWKGLEKDKWGTGEAGAYLPLFQSEQLLPVLDLGMDTNKRLNHLASPVLSFLQKRSLQPCPNKCYIQGWMVYELLNQYRNPVPILQVTSTFGFTSDNVSGVLSDLTPAGHLHRMLTYWFSRSELVDSSLNIS